jgi:hypothetical protein
MKDRERLHLEHPHIASLISLSAVTDVLPTHMAGFVFTHMPKYRESTQRCTCEVFAAHRVEDCLYYITLSTRIQDLRTNKS